MTIHLPIARIDTIVCNQPKKASSGPSFGMKSIEISSQKTAKFFKWAGDDFNSAQQRFISGVAGILLQPWFDLNNKRVDEDTRKISTARTLAKIIAGMATGVLIRWGLIEASKMFTKTKETELERVKKAIEKKKINYKPVKTKFSKWEQCLLPKAYKDGLKSFREIKKYRMTFGTIAAVGVMFFTNFLIDAPLTTFLTNKFVKMFNMKNEGGK